MNQQSKKLCNRCNLIKEIECFGITRGHSRTYCRPCESEITKINLLNPDRKKRAREATRDWIQKNRERYNESVKKNILKRKLQTGAINRVFRALKKGILKKENCIICNSKITEAHHWNYKHPLSVIWLCRKHHTEHHVYMKKLNSIKSKQTHKTT